MGQFSSSNYEQKKSYKDLFAAGKNDPRKVWLMYLEIILHLTDLFRGSNAWSNDV